MGKRNGRRSKNDNGFRHEGSNHIPYGAQAQQARFQFRSVLPITFEAGISHKHIGIAKLAETGHVANVYGYDSSPMAANMFPEFELFYIDSLTIKWVPSNYVGVSFYQGNVSQNVISTAVSPAVIREDPMTYDTTGYTQA